MTQIIVFLDQQYQALKPHERLVTLKLDEVQIKPKLEYRSGEPGTEPDLKKGYALKKPKIFFARFARKKKL